jgi:hypothetical protein
MSFWFSSSRLSPLRVVVWGLLTTGACLVTPAQLYAQVEPLPPPAPTTSPLSPDAEATKTQDPVAFTTYNDGYIELDLWRLEDKKFVRSRPVIAPDKQWMAYTEVIFMPGSRQTFSKLYQVDLHAPPDPPPVTPEPPLTSAQRKKAEKLRKKKQKKAKSAPPPPPAIDPRYDPDRYLRQRQTLASVGQDKTVDFSFRTLTVVDWSMSGERLLVKQKSGVLHTGLRTSDILVYERTAGTVTIYPEIQRALIHFWQAHGDMPNLETVAWDIFPMGWEPQSNAKILFKGWVFEKNARRFLGLWRYDIDAQRAELLSLDDTPVPIAANGLLAKPRPPAKK